ncbi:MAG: hypothetical protein ACRDPC_28745, partial [Solirubrobacteraceae bacterium]
MHRPRSGQRGQVRRPLSRSLPRHPARDGAEHKHSDQYRRQPADEQHRRLACRAAERDVVAARTTAAIAVRARFRRGTIVVAGHACSLRGAIGGGSRRGAARPARATARGRP